jgi:ribonuclease HI
MIEKFKVLQWNAQSVMAKKDRLEELLFEERIMVFCLCETWLNPQSNFKVRDYSIIRKDRSDGYGGVLIGIHKSINYSTLGQLETTTLEAVGVELLIGDTFKVIVISIYIPPGVRFNRAELEQKILQARERVHAPILVVGDPNAHSSIWDRSCGNDSRGQLLMEIFEDHDLICLNNGLPTRIARPPIRSSALDVTMCSQELAILNCNWNLINDSLGSDHLPIITSWNDTNLQILAEDFQPDYTRNVDWDFFRQLVDNKEFIEVEQSSVNDWNENFVNTVITSIQQAQTKPPITRKRMFNKPNRWWDVELSELKKKKKESLKKLWRQGTEEAFNEYNAMEWEFKNKCKIKKRENWKDYCSTLNKQSNLTEVWQMARGFKTAKSHRNYSNLRSDSWLPEFANSLTPDYVTNQVRVIHNECERDKWMVVNFSMDELEYALSKCNNSAPGMDRVKFSMIKNLSVNVKEQLLKFYNYCLRNGVVPEGWYKTKVIPILKPNKNPEEAKSYRPISLLACTRKVLERMMVNRLDYWVEEKKLISASQFGFRKGKSTTDCLALLTSDIQIAFEKKQEMLACFMDISGAYDNVIIEVLCSKLSFCGLPMVMIRLLWNILKKKELHFYYNNKTRIVKNGFIGLPQGSVLSPLLYNLYTSGIDREIIPECQILQYADDVVIYTSGKIIPILEERIQYCCSKLSKWFLNLGLTISNSKSECVLFSRKHILSDVNVSINNVQLAQKSEFKYLGMILHRKLNWHPHIKDITMKCLRRMNLLKCLAGVRWGAHPEVLLILYRCFIAPIIEYGFFCLTQAPKSQLIKLERIQLACLRICFGLMRSTHTGSIEVICGVPSVKIRYALLNYRYVVGAMFKEEHWIIKRLEKLTNLSPQMEVCKIFVNIRVVMGSQTQYVDLYRYTLKEIIFIPKILNNIRTQIPKKANEQYTSQAVMQIFLSAVESFDKNNLIFTDGSLKDGQASMGVFLGRHGKIGFSLDSPSSIFTAELSAIYIATIHLKTRPPGKYLILTDSLSAIEALKKNHIGYQVNQRLIDCKATLCWLKERGYDVSLMWIPSHVGIHGNEIADAIAEEALNANSLCLPRISVDCRKLGREYCTEQWQKCWDTGDKGRLCYSIFPKVKWKPWSCKIDRSRRFIVSISRMASNHYCLNSHLQRIKIKDSALCVCGQNYETVDHIVWNCDRFKLERQRFGLQEGSPVRDLIAMKEFDKLQRIIDFLEFIEVNV